MKLNFIHYYTTGLLNTQHNKLNKFVAGALLLSLLILTGCQSPVKKVDTKYTTKETSIQRADRLIAEARQLSSPQKETAELEAAQIYFQQALPTQSYQALLGIDSNNLSLQHLAEYSLLGANLAVLDDDLPEARNYLTNPIVTQSTTQLTNSTQQQWHRQRAQLFNLLNEAQLSITEYIALSSVLTDPQQIEQEHNQLWSVLSRLPQPTLDSLLTTERDQVALGWYTLAKTTRSSHGDILQLQKNIDQWHTQWKWHPAAMYPLASLSAIDEMVGNLPQQIALLLPLGGRYKASGKTALDGFMSAFYQTLQQNNTPPKIRVYDTTTTPDISTLYQQAITDGNQLIIGPLRKDAVESLNRLDTLPTPAITLNYLADESASSNKNLIQFGLSLTEEARQVARRAWQEGHRTALSITPDSSSGQRANSAFTDEWTTLGGELVAQSKFGSKQVDFTKTIKPVLLIDQSITRSKRLKQLLNQPVETGPERRRQDVDMIFLMASPEQGRQIKPMLDFFYAGDLPVYATSKIYSGHNNPGKDKDLDKIKFPAMPWILSTSANSATRPSQDLHPSYQQLFALGADAFQMHQGIQQMEIIPEARLYGNTGTLYFEQGKVLREQPWAEFRNGKVRAAKFLTKN